MCITIYSVSSMFWIIPPRYPLFYHSLFWPWHPFPVITTLPPNLFWRTPWYAQEIGVTTWIPRDYWSW
ncbi:MAG: hypothetical protein ACUVTM_07760 [Candidatus Bathyarchaeia archaeon]